MTFAWDLNILHMSKSDNKVTINDVARVAGVSKGTVDRVLHNRGEVSAKSRKRFLKQSTS